MRWTGSAAPAFGDSIWLPVKGWAFTGGDYMVAIRGNAFIVAERAKLDITG